MPNLVLPGQQAYLQKRFHSRIIRSNFALRSNANGQYIQRSTNLPGIALFTIMAWVREEAVSAVNQNLWTFGGSGADTNYQMYISTTGNVLRCRNSITSVSGTIVLVARRWYHVAVVVSGTGAGQFLVYLNSLLEITNSGNSGLSATLLWFFNDPFAQFFNGALSAIKVYNFAMTRGQIKAEMPYMTPVRTTGLNTWLPMLGPWQCAGLDFSGNKYNMTTTGTMRMETGPPIAWAPPGPRKRYKAPAGAGVSQRTLTLLGVGL